MKQINPISSNLFPLPPKNKCVRLKKNINNQNKIQKHNIKKTLVLKIDLNKLQKQLPQNSDSNNTLVNLNGNIHNILEFDTIEEVEKEIPDFYSQRNFKHENNNLYHRRTRSLNDYGNKITKFFDEIPQKTLVLDLDETLVSVKGHKINNSILKQYEFFYPLPNEQIDQEIYSKGYLTIRPYLFYFLNEIKKFFNDIIIFTSSKYIYAKEILKIIDKNNLFSKVYSRENLTFYKNVYYKDLNILNSDLAHTIIIDDKYENFLFHRFNGLPISDFVGNPKDIELLKILPILKKLSFVNDVRKIIKVIVDPTSKKIKYNFAYDLLKIDQKNIIENINNIVNNSKIYKKNKFTKINKLNNNSNIQKSLSTFGINNTYINSKNSIVENNNNILTNDYYSLCSKYDITNLNDNNKILTFKNLRLKTLNTKNISNSNIIKNKPKIYLTSSNLLEAKKKEFDNQFKPKILKSNNIVDINNSKIIKSHHNYTKSCILNMNQINSQCSLKQFKSEKISPENSLIIKKYYSNLKQMEMRDTDYKTKSLFDNCSIKIKNFSNTIDASGIDNGKNSSN